MLGLRRDRVSIVVNRDLAGAFGDARDQGARPTCLAFASSDCHAAMLGPWDPLSCEWIYHRAQARSGRSPADGATLESMLEALRHDGQPIEAEWPYQPTVVEPWTPPAGSPAVFRAAGEATAADVDAVVAMLDSGRPAVMLMTLSRSFYLPDPDGVVRAAAGELPDPAVRHAVVRPRMALSMAGRRCASGTAGGLDGGRMAPPGWTVIFWPRVSSRRLGY